MVTKQLTRKIYLVGIGLALIFAIVDTAWAVDDTYGPQPPAGYVIDTVAVKPPALTQRLSSFWSTVKEKVSRKISEFRSSPLAEKAEVATEQSTGREPSPRGNQSTVAPLTQPDGAYDYTLVPVREIGGPVHTQPALLLSKSRTTITTLPVPEFVARPKRAVLEIATLGPFSEIKRHERYAVPTELAGAPELPKALATAQPVLLIYADNPIVKVERLPDDTLTMIGALFSWLGLKHDDAAKVLHTLGLKSKHSLIRQKSLAFAGWILEQKNFDSMAALAFWRGLASSTANTDSRDYDNAIAEALSQMAHRTSTAKAWLNVETAQDLNSKQTLSLEAHAYIALVLAEHSFDKGNYTAARKLAQAVPAKTSWKEQARYLAAASTFALKDTRENLESAGRELTELFRTVENPEVFDATATTLGRIHFMLGNYKASHKYLSQVSRDTNLYIESAVDNGWALLRSGDRNHAVGNMFTLHTPYFEGAYMPDSYFLQSLGYQEICQFGDAMTAVKKYKQLYNQAFGRLIAFNAKGKTSEENYYADLTSFLSKKDFEMPPIVLRELGRHPQFLRRQKILNAMTRDERGLAAAMPLSAPALLAWAEKPVEKSRVLLKREIASFMKTKALAMEEEIKFVTANMSLLEYEIYAGAGNNLSLQGAKNFAIDDKAVPKQEFEIDKEYWPYEDEIWEDELNHFRSKMVDSCAKRNLAGEQS